MRPPCDPHMWVQDLRGVFARLSKAPGWGTNDMSPDWQPRQASPERHRRIPGEPYLMDEEGPPSEPGTHAPACCRSGSASAKLLAAAEAPPAAECLVRALLGPGLKVRCGARLFTTQHHAGRHRGGPRCSPQSKQTPCPTDDGGSCRVCEAAARAPCADRQPAARQHWPRAAAQHWQPPASQ